MSSKPKKADYQPSASDKASASVAMAEYEYFKQQYDPLLREMRDKSMTEDVASGLRGRANADVMQALSGPSYQAAARGDGGGDLSQALQGQTNVANIRAQDVTNKMRTNVLGTARGQAADAQTGMAEAARLGTSAALERARANQQVAEAKFSAAGQVAGAALMQGLENMGTESNTANYVTGQKERGSFFTPVDTAGNKVTGFKNRLGFSGFFGG
jgi:hypothetical protein